MSLVDLKQAEAQVKINEIDSERDQVVARLKAMKQRQLDMAGMAGDSGSWQGGNARRYALQSDDQGINFDRAIAKIYENTELAKQQIREKAGLEAS